MDYKYVIYAKAERVATLTLHRPEVRNAYTPWMEAEMLSALREAETDPEVGVVVLNGAGKAFCVGADLNMWKGDGNQQSRPSLAEDFGPIVVPVSYRTGVDAQQHDLLRQMLRMTKPIVVAIHGYAVGIGATIPLAADIRLLADSARVGYIFVKRALTPEFGSTFLLPRVVGLTRAKELLLSGRIFDAQEAKEMGLATEVVPEAQLMDRAMEIARTIAMHPGISVAFIKRGLNMAMEASLEQILDYEHWAFYTCMRSQDFRESIRAFVEKREPQFRGR